MAINKYHSLGFVILSLAVISSVFFSVSLMHYISDSHGNKILIASDESMLVVKPNKYGLADISINHHNYSGANLINRIVKIYPINVSSDFNNIIQNQANFTINND
jgi:hypothetical protein